MVIPERRRIGKYEILSKLGRGGMADVYLAQDPDLERTVALKVIEVLPDADSRETIEAERRGAELQSRLSEVDARVVKIFNAVETDGYFAVAMEYVEGEDLSELMRHGPARVDDAVDIALAICQTLHNAHTLKVTLDGRECLGIVHGDIKPKNIRIDHENRVRVLDFGIAKALSLSRKLTRNEFGSVPYASPERLDSGEVNFMSDLWSLGVLLYELIAGSQPYQAESTERLERMIRSRIPAPPAPDPCPESMRRVLMKSMDPEPSRRYQSAADLAADLAAFRAGAAVKAETEEDADATRRTFHREPVDDSTRRTAVRPPPASPVRSKPSVPPTLWQRRMGTFWRVLAGFLVLWVTVKIVTGIALWRNGQQLERDIDAETTTDPDAIWTQWTNISQQNPTALTLFGPRRTVEKRLVAAANRVIETSRNGDNPPVYEADWKRARTYLAHALELDPGNETVRGELRLCEGQIDRINGTQHHDAALLNEAVEKFEDAEHALPHSPDPELGLARVYVYGLKDIDRAYSALQEAERRGYKLGDREKSQLADGYRDRADRLWWDSRNVRGLPQEKDQIQRAADDYRRALELYQSIVPYAGASTNIVRVQNSLNGIETRLAEIPNEPSHNPT